MASGCQGKLWTQNMGEENINHHEGAGEQPGNKRQKERESSRTSLFYTPAVWKSLSYKLVFTITRVRYDKHQQHNCGVRDKANKQLNPLHLPHSLTS
ncbi:hypothetical protein AVEN_197871-1 [Araneus ventricosus]|uniref:Uncharacterized protein n=1 Tax=Araneus ventricosus TaxID=182803 RepID=A0A4Y2SX35_ARAVE|nr:hypothetical protein AVEN_197871-1 [Araneus ventricosus]